MAEQTSERMTRISSSIYGVYHYKGSKAPCVITDFSVNGLAITTNQLLVEGDLIRIKADLPHSSVKLDIWCVVRNVQGRKVGLEFEEISNEQKNNLIQYVYSILDTSQLPKTEKF